MAVDQANDPRIHHGVWKVSRVVLGQYAMTDATDNNICG